MEQRKPALLGALREHWPLVVIGVAGLFVAYLTLRKISGGSGSDGSVPAGGTSQPNFTQTDLSSLQDAVTNMQAEISGLQAYIANPKTPNPPTPTKPPIKIPPHPVPQPPTRSNNPSGAPSGWRLYTVQAGDTLADIGARFGTSWQNLFARNQQTITQTSNAHGNPVPGGPQNNIFTGEQLWVP